MFENKIYKMNPKHNLLPATLDILTLTLEISPSTLDKNLHQGHPTAIFGKICVRKTI